MTIADWVIVGVSVVSAIAATTSAVVAVMLWKIVVADRWKDSYPTTRMGIAGAAGVPTIHLNNLYGIERALAQIVHILELEEYHDNKDS